MLFFRIVKKKNRSLDSIRIFTIKNPLIVILGIGEYEESGTSLLGVATDYKNIIHAFNNIYNYSTFYATNDNKYAYADYKIDLEHEHLSKKVKLEWTVDEVDDFFTKARNTLVKNEHDSLIAVITCHGDDDGVIIASDGEPMQLFGLYYKFMTTECEWLQDKPKLMFVDACRGKMLSSNKKKKNENENDSKITNKSDSIDTSENNCNNENANCSASSGDDLKLKGSTGGGGQSSNKIASKLNQTKNYHKEGNFRFIYAAIDGYAVVEGGKMGGYLIRAIHTVFKNEKRVLTQDLDKIIYYINDKAQTKAGTNLFVQHVEDVNRMDGIVRFEKNISNV